MLGPNLHHVCWVLSSLLGPSTWPGAALARSPCSERHRVLWHGDHTCLRCSLVLRLLCVLRPGSTGSDVVWCRDRDTGTPHWYPADQTIAAGV